MVKQYSQAYYVAKYMKLYSAVFCCIEYGRAAPSRGLPFYEQFPRVLKPIMTSRLQRWPPDDDVSIHIQILAEPFLAGF